MTRARAIAGVVALALCLGCQPSAKSLVADFNANRAKYEQLLSMIAEDGQKPMPEERRKAYRVILDALALQQISHGARPGEIVFTFRPARLNTRGCITGLTHMAEDPAPVVESIDDANPAEPTIYQHVDDGWYLFCHKS